MTGSRSWALFLRLPEGGPRLPMATLRQVALHAGAARPRTYLQGGNLAFEALPDDAEALRAKLWEELARREYTIDLVLRSAAELHRAAEACPFVDTSRDGSAVTIGFLADEPAKERVAALAAVEGAAEAFAVHGREVYLNPPDAATKARWTPEWFEEQLDVRGTFRSWNTVQQMLRMVPVDPSELGPGLGRAVLVHVVADLGAAVAFYRDALALPCEVHDDRAEVRAGGLVLVLEKGEPRAAGVALHFEVADLDASCAVLGERGIQVERGGARAILRDPDGLELRIVQG